MHQDNDMAYYRHREIAATALADGCCDDAIKRIHIDMAERYAVKVRESVVRPQLRTV